MLLYSITLMISGHITCSSAARGLAEQIVKAKVFRKPRTFEKPIEPRVGLPGKGIGYPTPSPQIRT